MRREFVSVFRRYTSGGEIRVKGQKLLDIHNSKLLDDDCVAVPGYSRLAGILMARVLKRKCRFRVRGPQVIAPTKTTLVK